MNVLNALKGLFKGKGGTDVDDFNITDSAVSSTMRSATSLWWDAFQGQLPFTQTHKNFKPLPVAYTSTAYLAQLVTGEIKFEVADEELNKHVQKNLLPNLDRIVQQTLVGGYTVIKPYFVQSGEMFFDSGTSRDFLPMALDENGHITEGVFFERIRYRGKIYERREHHTFQNGVHTVRNTAYLYGTKHAVELATVPKWAVLLPEGRILSDIPMIATFRTPYANNIDLDSELPISIFANSLGTLHEIDEAHSEYCAEFKKMSAKVFADRTVLKENSGIPDRGRKFLLDKMDVDETNFVASASAVMSEFQRTKVIPEVDAYRYSRIYALAKDNYGRRQKAMALPKNSRQQGQSTGLSQTIVEYPSALMIPAR